MGVAETLVKTRPRVLASTDRKRCLSFEQLQKVVVCPLITMKHSKVIPSHGNCHLKFMNPSNNCTDQGGVPDGKFISFSGVLYGCVLNCITHNLELWVQTALDPLGCLWECP